MHLAGFDVEVHIRQRRLLSEAFGDAAELKDHVALRGHFPGVTS